MDWIARSGLVGMVGTEGGGVERFAQSNNVTVGQVLRALRQMQNTPALKPMLRKAAMNKATPAELERLANEFTRRLK